jgi:hypothetical protein
MPGAAKTVDAPLLRSFNKELIPISKRVLSCNIIDVDNELACLEKVETDDIPCAIVVLNVLTGTRISIVENPQPTVVLNEDRP